MKKIVLILGLILGFSFVGKNNVYGTLFVKDSLTFTNISSVDGVYKIISDINGDLNSTEFWYFDFNDYICDVKIYDVPVSPSELEIFVSVKESLTGEFYDTVFYVDINTKNLIIKNVISMEIKNSGSIRIGLDYRKLNYETVIHDTVTITEYDTVYQIDTLYEVDTVYKNFYYTNGSLDSITISDDTTISDSTIDVKSIKVNNIDYDVSIYNDYLEVSGVFIENIKIYTINGTLIKEDFYNEIYVGGLKKGTYIAYIETNEGEYISHKFVK
jgi:hypothetical protein